MSQQRRRHGGDDDIEPHLEDRKEYDSQEQRRWELMDYAGKRRCDHSHKCKEQHMQHRVGDHCGEIDLDQGRIPQSPKDRRPQHRRRVERIAADQVDQEEP